MTVLDEAPAPSETPRPDRPPRISPPWDRRRIQLSVVFALLALASLWSIGRVDISIGALVDGWDNMWRLFFGIGRPTGIWPPRVDDLGEIVDASIETFFMAVLATAMAAVVSFPLGFLAARNTTPHPVARYVARGIIALARTIPDLIFAAIFVRAFRIGPAAGVLAIGLHAVGMCGKLLADAIEEIEPGQREGVATTGAGWFQQMSTGVLPQVTPSYLGIVLYRLDINFRSSTILGLVGAGGIGELLRLYQGNLRWDLYAGVTIAIMLTVLAVEWVSVTGRRMILGHDRAGDRRRRGRLVRTREQLGQLTVSADDFTPAGGRDPVLDLTGPEPRLSPTWTPDRVRLAVFSGVLGVLVVASFWLSGVDWAAMANGFRPQLGDPGPGELPTVWNIAIRLVPTNLDWWDESVRTAMVETVAMGLAATALGLPIAVLLGYLGARNVAPNRFVYVVSRLVQVLTRAMPEIIIAVLLVAAVGLGPFPGTIALAIGVVAVGAKFFSDAIEVLDENPRDGVRATGATRLQEISSAVTPQFVPNLVANGLYLLDIMIRSSTILGIVGAGGIGFILFQSTRLLAWDVVGGLLLLVFVVVFAIERLSDWLRKRLI